ncbi:MAG: hypothetical protein K2P92_02330 [Bdellovibrionaceae bacterium]|nr:hypothetical protein [Pseudobdellovibrionaceae bacterium]
MKAARNYTERWEAENWLRLNETLNRTYLVLRLLFKNIVILLNLALYAIYSLAKYILLTLRLIFLTEINHVRLEREESWIFRSIK